MISDYINAAYLAIIGFLFDPNSKFYWLYTGVYLVISFFLVVKHLKKISTKGIFLKIFPHNIYTSRSALLDIKIIVINSILIFPILNILFGTDNLEEGGNPDYLKTQLREFLKANFAMAMKIQPSNFTQDIFYTIGLFLVVDFAFYWAHYLQHKVPFLWELHKLHHTATVLTPVTSYRTHPLSALFQKFVIVLFVYVYIIAVQATYPLKYTVVKVIGISFMVFLYNIFVLFRHSHVWISFGIFNYIFLSPAMHVIHHSKATRHLDKNIGLMFSIWDILFKTVYIPKQKEKLSLGLYSTTDQEGEEMQNLKNSYLDPFKHIIEWIKKKSFLNKTRWIPIVIVIFMVLFGIKFGGLRKNPFNEFSSKSVPKEIIDQINFKFTDVSSRLGVTHLNTMLIPHLRRAHMPHWSSVYGGVSVADVNNDGFMDIFFARANQNEDDLLYINIKGDHFIESSNLWNLPKGSLSSTSAVFFDVNKDGFEDLYIARIGCHSLLLNNKGKNFIDVSEKYRVNKICAWTTSVALLDANNDGYLDIYLGNYHDTPGIKDPKEFPYVAERSRNNRAGGKNILLRNVSGNYFEDISQSSETDDSGYAFAIGISDFDANGMADIFVANDYGDSQLYLNQGGLRFFNETKKIIGRQKFKASMSASVADINNDGNTDIYVSNISDPGDPVGRNALLLNKVKSMPNKAKELDLDKCGFGWGTQIFDPDNDGGLDVVAVNGFWNDGPKNYWYRFLTIETLPPFIRVNPENYPTTAGTQHAGDQKPCLFYKYKKKYYDISTIVGLKHTGQGRAVAIIDYDNDGLQDLIITQTESTPLILRNDATKAEKNNWVGLSLVGRQSPADGTGARIFVTYGARGHYMREVYSVQGYASQNDKRLILGINKSSYAQLMIKWPSGKEQKIRLDEVNQYYKLEEPK